MKHEQGMVSAVEMVVDVLLLEHPITASHLVMLDPPDHSSHRSFLSPH